MVRDALRDAGTGMTAPPTPGFWRMVGRACTRRCCVCGSGHLFRRWTRMVARCPRCGYLFERQEGQFIGAVGMNTLITFGLLLVVLVSGFIATSPHTPAVPLALIGVGIAVIAPVVIYPFSKTTWTAIDLAMTPLETGEAPLLAATRPTATAAAVTATAAVAAVAAVAAEQPR